MQPALAMVPQRLEKPNAPYGVSGCVGAPPTGLILKGLGNLEGAPACVLEFCLERILSSVKTGRLCSKRWLGLPSLGCLTFFLCHRIDEGSIRCIGRTL